MKADGAQLAAPWRAEAAVFDWGATLTPPMALPHMDQWRASAFLLYAADTESAALALARAETEIWAEYLRGGPVPDITDVPGRAAADLALDLPESVEESILNAHLSTMRPLVRVRPEAAAVLDALRARGIRTALLSSTHWPPCWHEELLAADGVLGLLDERVYGAELQRLKPHPAAFRAVLDRLGVKAHEAVHIGDQAVADVEGARQAGMRTIWFRTGREPRPEPSADAAVSSLSEVVAVLDDWAALPPTVVHR